MNNFTVWIIYKGQVKGFLSLFDRHTQWLNDPCVCVSAFQACACSGDWKGELEEF